MRTIIGIVCSLALTNSGLALPVGDLNCLHLRSPAALKPLVDKVAWYQAEGTKMVPIDKFKGLSEGEKKHIRQVTGYVFCKGKSDNQGPLSSAFLVGSNNQVMTAFHEFKDPETKRLRPNLSTCFFQNQSEPPVRIPLDLTDAGGPNLNGPNDYPENQRSDRAIAKLKTPLKNAVPLPVDVSGKQIWDGDRVMMVSAHQDGLKNKTLRDPYVQDCTVFNSNHSRPVDAYFSDCDLMGGGSGGIQLQRSPEGQLVIRAMAIGSGTKSTRESYDFDRKQYSVSLGISGPVIDQIQQVYPQLAPGNGALP